MNTRIRLLDEVALGAWPALRQIHHDGWILRFSEGYTRRANSVNPLYEGTLDVREKIGFCERLYRERGMPVIFRLTAASEPSHLDELLEQGGYEREVTTQVQCLDLTAASAVLQDQQDDPGIITYPMADERWVQAYLGMGSLRPEYHDTFRRITRAIVGPSCFACRVVDGQVVACGNAVAQGNFVGLFDVITHPQFRHQGHAAALVGHLLRWASSTNASTCYLQVMEQNLPALSLYGKLGFQRAYTYWYRVRR